MITCEWVSTWQVGSYMYVDLPLAIMNQLIHGFLMVDQQFDAMDLPLYSYYYKIEDT